MAQRLVNAETRFLVTVQHISGCTAAVAARVLALYLKIKAVKLNATSGQFEIKHGALLDQDVIHRAIAQSAPAVGV
jgi:hypothetical protein